MTTFGQLATGRAEVKGTTYTFGFTKFKEATTMADHSAEQQANDNAITTSYKGHARAIRQVDLDTMFTYHSPKGDQQARYMSIRVCGKMLAEMIVDCCPPSADTTAAIRLLRESIMTANQSIACGE